MTRITLLVLGMMATVYCATISPHDDVCDGDCELAHKNHHTGFKHMSIIIGNISAAPWTLKKNSVAGRDPENIQEAVCQPCSVTGMTAEPILIQIPVFQQTRTKNNTIVWCKCPLDVAVGCTCVKN